jgi:hypothetical protein
MGAAFIYLAGLVREFIVTVAANTSVGGGPAQALQRLVQRENLTTKLDPDSPVTQTANFFDETFRWLLNRLLNVIPDVSRFDYSAYVSDGFDVSATNLTLSLLQLCGYLLPWGVLAYYLLRSREVAS